MKPLSDFLIPIEEDTNSFKTETTPIKVDVPVVNQTVETNITDGAEINKQAIEKVQNVSDNNFSNATITDSTPDGFFKTAIRTNLNTPFDFLKNFIVGAGGTAQELYYAEKAEGEVIFDKGVGEYIKETRKEVIDYYKQKGLKDIAEETGLRYKGSSVVDDSQPDIIARLMPNMAKLRDENYLRIGQDVVIDENNVKINDIAIRENDFTEKRKLHAEKVVKWMVQTNDTIQSVLDKTGLPKNERDGLKYDLLGTPSQVLMSLIPLYIFKKPKLIAGAYAFMQKAQTTIDQYKKGDTAEDALMIGNKTATFSGIAELVELSVFKKWFLAPEVKNAIKQTYMEAMKQFYKTKGFMLWGKSILNEGFTGAVQEIGNIYIPEKYGKSNGQTFLENLYQIGVASAMEGLGGAIGSAPFVVHYSLYRMAFNMGMKEEEAKALADDLTSVVSQQAEQMRDSFVKEVTKEMTPEEQTKLANEITIEIEKVKQTQEGTVQQEEENPLIVEARKYKSADEFVKSQINAYHGTDKDFNVFSKDFIGENQPTDFGQGLSFSKDKQSALGYAKEAGGNIVMEVRLDIKNPAKNEDLLDTDIQNAIEDDMGFEDVGDVLKGKGFDGIEYTRSDGTIEYTIFDTSKVKTKSQLTDIWTKSQTQNLNIQEEEIPVGIKGALFGKVQNQEQADAMAEVLQSTNFLNQKVSGVETDAMVNNETQNILTSDLENLSYLSDVLNPEQTQEQIVNNASNLFLQTTLKARQTEVGKQSGVVTELDTLIGKPVDNKYSQEQIGKLQEEFYNYLITGKAKSKSQKNLFNGMKSQLSRTYYKLSEKNMLDDKTENAYRALTKELNPKLEPIEINEQTINDLKEEITNLRNGKPTSVKKINFINQMIKFGQTYQDTKASEEDVKLWNLYADTYKKLFGNQVNLNQVKGAIEMLDQKGFFVFDETKYNSLLDNLVNAKKKLEKVVRTDLNDMKNKFNSGLSTLNTMLNKLEDLGISSKNLNDSVLNIDPNATTSEQLLNGIDQIQEALFQTRKLLNNKYISSEYYKISKKDFEKPIINSGNIRTRIETTIADFVVGKNYEELQSDIENNSLELTKRIAKDLKVFDAEIQNKIKNTLLKAKTVNDIYNGIDKILDDIETKINKDYIKKINKKIKEQMKELKSNANHGVMTYNDNVFFKNIFNFVKTFKDSIPNILAIEMSNKIKIDNKPLFSEDINFANEQIAKLKEKITDDLSVDDRKVIENDIEMWQMNIKSLENDVINKYINQGVDFNQFSKNGDKQPFALDERQISLAKSFMQYLYNEHINNNDAVDNLYDLYKNLESFSKASMEEQNAKIAEKQNWLKTKTTEVVDYLGKLKVLPAYPLFLKTFADINNFMSLAFGQKFSNEFSTIQAETEANLMFNKAKNKLDTFIKKMVNTDKYGYAFSLMKGKPFSESKNKTLKEMDMNKAEALYFYIQSLNPKGLIAVLNAVDRDGLTEIESVLSNEDKRIGKYMSDVLVELYPQINEVYETRFNKPMGKENVFFPIKYKYDTQSEQIEEVGDFGKSIFNEIIINNPSFIKSRTNSQRALDKRNPFTIFERYVQDASMYVHITPILNNLLSILEFGKDSIKKVMIPKIGDSAYNTLETLIKGIQGTLETNNISHLSGESKLNEFVNNVILSKVMGKLFTSYKQLFGVVNFAEVMPVKDFSKHISYAYTHFPEIMKDMFERYPQLQDRYEHSINDPIVQKIVDIDRRFKGVQKIKEYSTWSIRAFDMISSVSGAYAYTKYLESLGKYSPEEIKTKVINQVWSSQGSSLKSTTDLLSMSEKRPLMKALNAFRINQKQFFRKSVMAVHDYYNGKISLEQATKTLSIYLVINPVLYGIASMPVTAWTVFTNLDDEDEREELYKLVIRPIINNITSIGPILEFVTMPIIDEFAKGLGYKSYKQFGGLKPLMFYDVIDSGVTMLKLAFGKTHDSIKTLESILGGLQPLTAVPLVPASRIATGVYNIAEGEFLKAIANIANIPKSEMKKFIDN